MKKFSNILLAVSVFTLFLAACARPPADEMNKAQDAVVRAENDAGALGYAENTLVRARDALTRMQSEADAKRYDAAKNFAAEAVSLAEKAIADGKTGAARAKDEAANLINSLETPLGETAGALNAAREAGNMPLDFDSLSADVERARRTYDEARQSLDAENYPDAEAKARDVRSILAGVNVRITDAAAETSRKQ